MQYLICLSLVQPRCNWWSREHCPNEHFLPQDEIRWTNSTHKGRTCSSPVVQRVLSEYMDVRLQFSYWLTKTKRSWLGCQGWEGGTTLDHKANHQGCNPARCEVSLHKMSLCIVQVFKCWPQMHVFLHKLYYVSTVELNWCSL